MVAFNLKRGVPMALGAAALSMVAVPAHAQTPEKPISIRAGINYPIDGDVRDATNDIGFAVGLSYDLKSREGNGDSNPRLDLDWVRNSGNGSKLDRVGVFAMYKFYFGSEKGGRKRMYAGIGIGVSRLTARTRSLVPTGGNGGGNSDTGGESDTGGGDSYVPPTTGPVLQQTPPTGSQYVTSSEHKTRIGGKAILGYDFNDSTFVEASYTFNGKLSGVRTDSFALQAGIRF